MAKLTTEEFIKKAREVHGDKYDYSKVEYVNARVNVCIICPKHGEFWQRPSHHTNGCGCPACSYESNANNSRIWTKEKCYEVASSYTNYKLFRTENAGAYDAALNHKWLKDYTWLTTDYSRKWTKDKCYEVASQYKEMSAFRTENQSAYNAALKHKWLKDYTWLSYKIDVSKPKRRDNHILRKK